MSILAPSHRAIASLAITLVAGLVAGGALMPAAAFAADDAESPNLLDRPMADLALLEGHGPDGMPRLLTLRPPEPGSASIRASILQRDRAWQEVSTLDIALPSDAGPIAAPWLIGTGPTRFAMIVTAIDGSASLVVALRTDGGPNGTSLAEVARTVVSSVIDNASAADVDGDGTSELVLSEPPVAGGLTCSGSTIIVLDAADLAVRSSQAVAGMRLAGGVIGRWDDVAGQELLVYATATCPGTRAEPNGPTLLVVPMRPGARVVEPFEGAWMSEAVLSGAPLGVDLDGDSRDEAIAQIGGSQAILDPARDWSITWLGEAASRPLIVATTGATDDRVTRVVWLGWDIRRGYDSLVTAGLRRGSDGVITLDGEATLSSDAVGDRERWDLMLAGVNDAAHMGAPPAVWAGGTVDPACHDLFVPLAILPCGETALRPAAAWVATRALAAIGEGSQRRLLVAGGLDWHPSEGLPRTPTPWAAAPAGWWRQGPSAPFVIAELRAADATYFRDFPVPRSTVGRVVSPERTADLTGFTGTRLFVRSTGLADDSEESSSRPMRLAALTGEVTDGENLTVTRIPVPPGVQAGGDGGFASVTLAEASRSTTTDPPGGAATVERWAVTVVPISNWGELGTPVHSTVARDVVGPSVSMEAPFTSSVWPFAAELHGIAEVGTEVTVGDLGPVTLDRRGRFAVQMPIAPWPQTIRLTATDASGNRTVREVSVIGGLDYRRLPWPAIVAVILLALAALSGVVGSRRARATAQRAGFGSLATYGSATGSSGVAIGGHGSRWRTSGFGIDDPPPPEIEELPPGQGLPRADAPG